LSYAAVFFLVNLLPGLLSAAGPPWAKNEGDGPAET